MRIDYVHTTFSAGDGQVQDNDCTTRVQVNSYADAGACCSVPILLFNCAQLRLKYRRDKRRRDSRRLRRHVAKKDDIWYMRYMRASFTGEEIS